MKTALYLLLAVGSTVVTANGTDIKRIILLAGPDSHQYGAHDHRGVARVLAHGLNESTLAVQGMILDGGWPRDESVLQSADAIIIASDGLEGHVLNKSNRDTLNALHSAGVGLGFLHYACAVDKETLGNDLLRVAGGYYETHWSVNPWWTADFSALPDHPITRGVRPFSIHDEWYYHMRFRPDKTMVTPLLTAVPPERTRRGKDGPHSGNPHVRARVGMEEHVAWAAENQTGGRGFGFTGLHDYWNLGHPEFRKLLLNACLWLTRAEVPAQGVSSPAMTLENLVRLNPGQPDDRWTEEMNRTWADRIRDWNSVPTIGLGGNE